MVNIYETQRKFHEIAFAEDFYQYIRRLGAHPDDVSDSLPKIINDSAWVTLDSGVPSRAKSLFGNTWKGLRGIGSFRINLPEDMGGGTTIATYSHAFVTCSTPRHSTLVFDFCEQPSDTDLRVRRLNEIMFYEMICSLNWIDLANSK